MDQKKSIVELRGIAQAIGASFKFSDDVKALQRAIDKKRNDIMPVPPPIEWEEPSDQRLRTKPPSRNVTQKQVNDALAEHKARGLKLSFPNEETWLMSFSKKQDSGTLRMPLRVIIKCAEEVLS